MFGFVLKVLVLALVAVSAAAAVPPGCTAAAAKYPGAAVACDNAALVSDLLRTKWSPKSSDAVQKDLKKSAATPGVYGAAVAFAPAAIKKLNITKAPLHSPYCHAPAEATGKVAAEDVTCIDIGDTKAGGYDYTDATLNQTAWYTGLAGAGAAAKAKLSGVYFDKGGGDIWMDTLSVPVFGPDGKLAAVATADVRAKAPANATSDAATGAAGAAPAPAGAKSGATRAGPGAAAAAAVLVGALGAVLLAA